MITNEVIKTEIDKVQEKYLEVLYKIIKIFESPSDRKTSDTELSAGVAQQSWQRFVAETYGSLSDDPIERGDQDVYEIREAVK